MKHTKLGVSALVVGTSLAMSLFTGCFSTDNDTASFDYSNLPASYDAISTDMSYSGQLTREDMLAEMTAHLKTGNTQGTAVSATTLKNMFANENEPFGEADLNASTKQLKSKTFQADVAMFEAWMDAAEAASQEDSAATDSTAGVVGGKYLVSATGLEYTQVIEKGLMGAVLYYQGTAIYLDTADGGKLAQSVDNDSVIAGKGTDLAHHWDEAYGYFAAQEGFTAATTKEEGRRFWGHYSNSRNSLLNTTDSILAAFIKGRVAIGNKDRATMLEQIPVIRKHWERAVAGTAVHYLNVANTDADFNDDAKRLHELSEAKAFILSLKYNPEKVATDADIKGWLEDLGDNYWTITKAEVLAIRDAISAKYGFDSVKEQL
jgi:hypothetical protein